MSKKKSQPSAQKGHKPVWYWVLPLIATVGIAIGITLRSGKAPALPTVPEKLPAAEPPPAVQLASVYAPRPKGSLTFSRDIAPITLKNCAPCHHEGREAPFNLVTYSEVAKRTQQIVEVTQRDYMPPWPPARGYNHFQNERLLSPDEKGMLAQWVNEGAIPGDPKDMPPIPAWKTGWSLGEPDLVLTMSEPFNLAAEGADLYRNFVLPNPLDRNRFVRAVEFNPANPRIVHHAFIFVDPTHACRRRDADDPGPGFTALNVPAESPDGQFLSWQPGKTPNPSPSGLAWTLKKDSDLVLQMHLNRSGKPESIQSSIGLYFTEQAPTNVCFKFKLTDITLDIPAGTSNYVITNAYTLPVDVEMLAVLPHAHYIAREMEGYAVLPNGSKQWLLKIKDWDFNWQGDYRYAEPVSLPKGSTVWLRYTYDNSTNNVRNPNVPPQRVQYGFNSKDEMCELWFQALTHSAADYATLTKDYTKAHIALLLNSNERLVARNPNDAEAHANLGVALMEQQRRKEATPHFLEAVRLNAKLVQPHYFLGVIYRLDNQFSAAERELRTAIMLDPENGKAYGHLGFVCASEGKLDEAERCFKKGRELDPGDQLLQEALDELARARKTR